MEMLAEDLGTFLGTSERKANEWLAGQQQLRKQLAAIRDKATALLSQLGPGKEGKEAKGGEKGKGGKGKGAKGSAKAASKKPARKPSVRKPAPVPAAPEPEPMDLEGNDE